MDSYSDSWSGWVFLVTVVILRVGLISPVLSSTSSLLSDALSQGHTQSICLAVDGHLSHFLCLIVTKMLYCYKDALIIVHKSLCRLMFLSVSSECGVVKSLMLDG